MLKITPSFLKSLLSPIKTALKSMITRVVISSVNTDQAVFILTAKLRGQTNDKKIPIIQHFGFSSVPPKGSQAIVAHLSGAADSPVAIATQHNQSQLQGMLEGDSAIFDNRDQHFILTEEGATLVTADKFTITNPAGDTIFNSDGSIDFANGSKISSDGDFISATGVTLNTHQHLNAFGVPTPPPIV